MVQLIPCGEKEGVMIFNPYFNYCCRTQAGLGKAKVLLPSFLLVLFPEIFKTFLMDFGHISIHCIWGLLNSCKSFFFFFFNLGNSEQRRETNKTTRGEKNEIKKWGAACNGPPCITSLTCLGTDDIVGMGGGPARGMMSFVTNQRAHRHEPRPAPGWNRGVSEKNNKKNHRFLLSVLRADVSHAPFSPRLFLESC